MEIKVKQIGYRNTIPFITGKHYARRMPSITWAFGLYVNGKLEGVCTFGKPASNALCDSVCGKEYKDKVYELNRLIVNEGLEKNTLSRFVSQCLKLLKKEDLIIVSYADSGQNHCGYIYQATNFIYTGETKLHTDTYTPRGKHSRHATKNEKYNHLRVLRTIKHRYIYFTGKSRKKYLKELNYEIVPYPKKDNIRYVLGNKQKRQILNKKTNEIFFE